MNALTVSHIVKGRSETTESIEEGVYTDDRFRRNLRAEYAMFDRFEPAATKSVRLAAEEASWAARSGPVVVKRTPQSA